MFFGVSRFFRNFILMGHAIISTTMDIYNEATMEKKKASFENLEGKIKIG